MLKAGPGTRLAQYIKEFAEDSSGLKLSLIKKNSDWFYIQPPVFSDIQRSRLGGTDYRQGIGVCFRSKTIEIQLVTHFSPPLAQNFLHNTSQEKLANIFRKLNRISDGDFWVEWNSKAVAQNGHSKSDCPYINELLLEIQYISEKHFHQALEAVGVSEDCWHSDITAKLLSSGKGVLPVGRGHHFSFSCLLYKKDKEKIKEVVSVLAPLLHNFLPQKVNPARSDNIRRNLAKFTSDSGLKKVCAYKGCQRVRDLDACHIVPYSKGGSDLHVNGIWLCSEEHHLMQEGKDAKWHLKNLKRNSIQHTRLLPQVSREPGNQRKKRK